MSPKPSHKHIRRSRLILFSVAIIIGVGLLVFTAIGITDYFHRTQTGITIPSPSDVVQTSDTVVSEKKPTPITAAYTVSAGQPRVLKIPTLNIDAYVQKVGITAGNSMATPNNIYFTGWYIKSVAPGDSGVSIINGHAGGRYEQGVFRNIRSLKPDDEISVQMGDLSWRKFAVVSVNTYPVADAGTALFKNNPTIDKELHLITCDGVFDDKTQTYNERSIVVAKFIGS